MIQINTRTGRCNCNCGDPCPLGQIGMQYSCTEKKLREAGIPYKKNLIRDALRFLKKLPIGPKFNKRKYLKELFKHLSDKEEKKKWRTELTLLTDEELSTL